MILFCLPYAGGSKSMYYKWKSHLSPLIQLEPIELKARGYRYDEDFYDNFEEAVTDIFENIKDKLVDSEYAIFGHSMGSLLAYELYYQIVRENYKIPKHIFFSGCKPPSILAKDTKFHLLPDDEFIKKILCLGGTPKEVTDNEELLELVLPILRNDFRMIGNYKYHNRKEKIQCNISILNGKDDDITEDELLKWNEEGDKCCQTYHFEGGHFFINHKRNEIINIIHQTLMY
ncbi:MAG: thioesterase [Firmicutes bacterium]|nr:thioesterase [Bacillota bacterium]